MNKFALAASVLAFVFTASSAQAIQMTNRDEVVRKVTVVEGEKETTHSINPGDEVSLCKAGCIVRIESGEEFELTGKEIVSYEDNYLYDDSPIAEGGAEEPVDPNAQ